MCTCEDVCRFGLARKCQSIKILSLLVTESWSKLYTSVPIPHQVGFFLDKLLDTLLMNATNLLAQWQRLYFLERSSATIIHFMPDVQSLLSLLAGLVEKHGSQ